MLTAISVARECQMIEPKERVIVVTTEADRAGFDVQPSQKQTLTYSFETKSVCTFSFLILSFLVEFCAYFMIEPTFTGKYHH